MGHISPQASQMKPHGFQNEPQGLQNEGSRFEKWKPWPRQPSNKCVLYHSSYLLEPSLGPTPAHRNWKKNNSTNHFFFQFLCTGVVEAHFSIKTTWKWQCPCFSARTVLLKPSPASEPTQKMHKETRLIETCSVRFPRSACNNCYRGIWNVARLEGERSEP